LRLLFVAHCFPPKNRPLSKVGGMQRVGIDLLAALKRRDDLEIDTLILHTAGVGMAIKAVPFYSFALTRILKLCRSGRVDAVLFSAMASGWMSVLIKPLLARNVPMATICHGHDVIMDVAPYQLLVRRMFATLDAVFPVSRATGARVLERGLPAERLHVINNGIDLARYPAPPRREERRAILARTFPEAAAALQPEALVLCTTGRQIRRKGHAWFVDNVMPLLPAHIHFWLAGDGPEGPAIEAAAARHGLGGRVRRLGLLSDEQVANLYRGADLFVMPNIAVEGDIEGFGVVLLEAGLNGMTSIAARLEGIEDAVTHGANGFLVESRDAQGFAAEIVRLDRDRDRLFALGQAASQFTRQRFCWNEIAARYVEVLRAVASTS
jgi:phosphatidyl-myo-inositol dimannoside synthase